MGVAEGIRRMETKGVPWFSTERGLGLRPPGENSALGGRALVNSGGRQAPGSI